MADQFTLRFHHAMPNWAKVGGLKIKAVPDWEGGGFAVDREQAHLIAAVHDMRDALKQIAQLRADGPHVSAKSGMGAALGALYRARKIAHDTVTKAKYDPSEAHRPAAQPVGADDAV